MNKQLENLSSKLFEALKALSLEALSPSALDQDLGSKAAPKP